MKVPKKIFIPVLISVIAVTAVLYNKTRIENIIKKHNELTKIRQEFAAEEQRTTRLEAEKEQTISEEYIKKIAKERLRLVEDGEIVFEPK
ncbi:MAG: septum formation initiator family protein [Clostridiales bacterium]|jgi:cell division protein FtsB|nr:septum formation initiator family protein [Clostridiales bacterium]